MWNNISRLRHTQYIKERERERDMVSPAQFSENGPSDLYRDAGKLRGEVGERSWEVGGEAGKLGEKLGS